MNDTQETDVLNTPETPVENNVDAAPELIQSIQPEKSMYTGALKPTTQMSEKNHASEIASNAMSQADAKQTFSYTSQAAKEYDTSVNTSTIQSNNAEMKGTFESTYGMNDKYKANDNEDYQWNKLASEMSKSDYEQQASQARYESIQAKQELDKNASAAFNNYFAAEYTAKQTQDKMGWAGGQKDSSDLQVAFLQAETAANMYTQAEMQKYGVDTKLGIARMYAETNQKTLALKYYQDAVDLAVKEANETGYYIPPEAGEMMKQQSLASDILNNPYSTETEKERARSVNAAAEAYYDHLGFERGTRVDPETGKVVTEFFGIKTLSTLTYEETVRNNKVNEELQRQANNIAQQNANTAALQLEETRKSNDLSKAIQNQLMIDKVVSQGTKTKSGGTDWYYTDKGKAKHLDNDAEIYYTNNNGLENWYYIKSNPKTNERQLFEVFNENENSGSPNYKAFDKEKEEK